MAHAAPIEMETCARMASHRKHDQAATGGLLRGFGEIRRHRVERAVRRVHAGGDQGFDPAVLQACKREGADTGKGARLLQGAWRRKHLPARGEPRMLEAKRRAHCCRAERRRRSLKTRKSQIGHLGCWGIGNGLRTVMDRQELAYGLSHQAHRAMRMRVARRLPL